VPADPVPLDDELLLPPDASGGHSNGTSVALLPVQFSHCLALDDPASGRVVRANLVQTGIVLDKHIDAQLSFGLGPFSAGCRNRDLEDLKRLGSGGSAHDAVPLPGILVPPSV
jgi:hypothetical protein